MQTDLEFGTLIQNIRKQKGLEVRTLAEQVGVDASTISRIENLHTQATVYTAFLICDGLEISLSDLIYELKRNRPSLGSDTLFPLESKFVVNLQEVVSIVRSFGEDKQQTINILLDKINHILNEYDSYRHEIRRVTGPYVVTGQYSAGELERYFYRSPFSETYQLKYPPLSADLILQLYRQNGVLTPTDVNEFLKQKRTKNRLLPTSSIEKMKLFDILHLLDWKNEELDYGSVVGMIWEACRFLSKFVKFNRVFDWKEGDGQYYFPADDLAYGEFRVAMFYVNLCRWELQIDTRGFIWAI